VENLHTGSATKAICNGCRVSGQSPNSRTIGGLFLDVSWSQLFDRTSSESSDKLCSSLRLLTLPSFRIWIVCLPNRALFYANTTSIACFLHHGLKFLRFSHTGNAPARRLLQNPSMSASRRFQNVETQTFLRATGCDWFWPHRVSNPFVASKLVSNHPTADAGTTKKQS
jgi:hypothetical protein